MNKNRIIFLSYLIISFLLFLIFFLFIKSKTTIAGYWSERVLFWIWIIGTAIFCSTFWKYFATKIYAGILFLGIVLSILPMAIPFLAIILSTTGSGLRFNKKINDKYRVQITSYGVMSTLLLEIDERHGLQEKEIYSERDGIRINDSTGYDLWEIEDISYNDENDSLIFLQIHVDSISVKQSFKKRK
ncbi:hypothetical protein [Flavobacterium sp. H122]|uniref:hypothetical protein n=1 Tax=Flavobacterium sp. H122 TaxID=2529860 RepID=UPI0010A9D694|nr:hypothetical protein [Flavobacterium sp. H122]